MTTNKYFNEFKDQSDQNLVEELIIEGIQIQGLDVLYVPRTGFNPDLLLNESPNDKFETFYQIEAYLNTPEGYVGNGMIIEKWGMNVDNGLDFVISRRRFSDLTGMPNPVEGDLIYTAFNNALMSIDYVNHEPTQFYALQKRYVYELNCKEFVWSHEDFNTQIPKIDNDLNNLEDPFANNVVIDNEAALSLDFDPDDPFQDKQTEDR